MAGGSAQPHDVQPAGPFSAADTAIRDAPTRPVTAARPCPFCCEPVSLNARKCPHCQEYLDPALAAARTPPLPSSGLAKASLILGLLSPFLFGLPGPLAVLFGLLALVSPGRGRSRGTGLAIVGVLLGLLSTGVLVAMVLSAGHFKPPSEALPLF